MPRRSRKDAAVTRAAVVDSAAALGSGEGLDGLSIGRIASELGLSKSGVIGHFGSKENLQLAAVEAAAQRFRAEVWDPVAGEPAGLTRLRALMEAWLSYLEREVFPGGCFLTAAAVEFDDRPGAVRDAVAATWTLWLDVLEREAARAQAQEELASEISPRQIVLQLNAYVMAGNWNKQLFRQPEALTPSRVAIDRLLEMRPLPASRSSPP